MSSSGFYINPMPTSGNAPRGTPNTNFQPSIANGFSGSIRPTGPSNGFDPSYLQNLATNEGGLFDPSQGGMAPYSALNFNPLGNLADIPGTPKLGGGNAPLPGLPQTSLQNSLAQNPFFNQQQQSSTGVANPTLAQILAQAFGGSGGVSGT